MSVKAHFGRCGTGFTALSGGHPRRYLLHLVGFVDKAAIKEARLLYGRFSQATERLGSSFACSIPLPVVDGADLGRLRPEYGLLFVDETGEGCLSVPVSTGGPTSFCIRAAAGEETLPLSSDTEILGNLETDSDGVFESLAELAAETERRRHMKNIFCNEHVERDVAVEIMAWKIARCVTLRKGPEERDRLLRERMAMYLGDRTVIDRIMTEYAAEARECFGARPKKTP